MLKKDLWCLKKYALGRLLDDAITINGGVKSEDDRHTLTLKSTVSDKILYQIIGTGTKDNLTSFQIQVILQGDEGEKRVCAWKDDILYEVGVNILLELLSTLPAVIENMAQKRARYETRLLGKLSSNDALSSIEDELEINRNQIEYFKHHDVKEFEDNITDVILTGKHVDILL